MHYRTFMRGYMQRLYFILTFLLLAVLPSVAQPDSILHRGYAIQSRYVEQILNPQFGETQPGELDEMVRRAKENDDDAFAYNLEFAGMFYKIYPDNEATLRKSNENIKKAQHEGYKLEAIFGMLAVSRYYYRNYFQEKSIEYHLNAYDLYKDHTVHEFPQRAEFQTQLAGRYYIFNEYRKAIQIGLGLQSADTTSLQEITPDVVNVIALSYRELKMYDSSLYYFKLLYQHGMDTITGARTIATGNIGSIYYRMGRYSDALTWFTKELRMWEVLNNGKPNISATMTYAFIADTHYKLGNMVQAMVYLDTATSWVRNLQEKKIDLRHNITYQQYYRIASDIYFAKGRYKEAKLMLDTSLRYHDSAMKMQDRAVVSKAEKRIAAHKHVADMQKLEYERQKSVWVRNTLLAVILLISIIALLIINRNRLKHIQKQMQLEQEKASAEAKLIAFTTKLKENNLQLFQLRTEVAELTNEQDVAEKNELIRQLQFSTILTDEQWDDFRNIFEQVHGGYIARVKDYFPGITPAEIRYITLVKLDLNHKEMSNILGVSNSTVRNYKSRLRRKYGFEDEAGFEDIIKRI